MSEPILTCPCCGTAIPLTQSLAAPLLAAERKEIASREAAVARAQAGLDGEVAARVEAERTRLAAEAAAGAAAEVAAMRGKLAEAQAAQAEALRRGRALEEARRELDLTIEKRVTEGLAAAQGAARAQAEEAMRLKVAEKEQLIAGMQRTIDELKRRAEQGSQQLQGEVLELDLEAALAGRFPADAIEPVGKGVAGADVVQRVAAPGGGRAGVILWETKRARVWQDGWLAKLRADQRGLGAEVAVLISEALPKGHDGFGLVDGIWVAPPALALPLAAALRGALRDLAAVRAQQEGLGTKTELVYDYLRSPRFRHRVEAIAERFTDMAADLDREKRTMQKLWARREMQISGVLDATYGLYGDLQGIMGKALPAIEGLDTPLLDAPEEGLHAAE
ncbi:DUF2130 domain-containing protein [Amaricoccus sp.]|uniref:DUF2130 domain-containing protein n=1 Tax=Amaricoccus sp. TaxID=1872485 RepID=UPI001B54CBF2|nr:DUF2130 domain-containing protein [Amaricoccus sp.]MBP7002441.1 DUF2130 domain-containing protein [Amaricoccus sp.]